MGILLPTGRKSTPKTLNLGINESLGKPNKTQPLGTNLSSFATSTNIAFHPACMCIYLTH